MRRGLVVGVVLAAAALACSAGDLVVGDDSALEPGPGLDAAERDGASPDGAIPDGAPPPDAGQDGELPDATPGVCNGSGQTCLAQGAPCYERAKGDPACPNASDFCCEVPCPTLSPPAPSFCDGGPYAARYSPGGCIIGYACAPVACADAGGTCVGLAPGSCPSNRYGDASKYSCGGGIGTGCCLP
jgi:hypothetical protein